MQLWLKAEYLLCRQKVSSSIPGISRAWGGGGVGFGFKRKDLVIGDVEDLYLKPDNTDSDGPMV